MDDKSPKDVTRYQKHYSEKGLLEKIGATFKKAGLKVIYYVLLLYYVLNDENTPMQHKMIIIGALGYFILPVDLIPDFIPVVGYSDDVAALAFALHAVWKNVTPEIKEQAQRKLREWFGSFDPDELENIW